ncbi:asparaginase [Albidovulum inexpectatum]|uniref:Asparaginase n=1 Tax=Albidovulum inexpectatum TaxID=196587 RepID=A0A2S5JM85_9RHOB|nr:asparaginase [Albidovulum inexpectatum]PPB82560.1 asparaginase [Albidovulum inexpectatum]
MPAVPMIELWRGGLLESVHMGHAVICDETGQVVQAWGDLDAVIYPRSSCKMVQALPLVESGAADRHGLTDAHLALACASHSGAAIHTQTVERWLAAIGLSESDLRCGTHLPWDNETKNSLVCSGRQPCQLHNNCSGKHAGFLTYSRHIKAGPEYVEPDHPMQQAVRAVFEELTGLPSPGWGIDGCSAPNFATTVHGLARAMAFFAAARETGDARERAAHRLVRAMGANPVLVAGEGRACTELMRAIGGRGAIKTGAEAVYVAILPEIGRAVALKIVDGGTRASEAAMTALLVHLGVLDPAHPVVRKFLDVELRSWRGLHAGEMRRAPGFPA